MASLKAYGQYKQGKAAKRAGDLDAEQLLQKAGTRRAAGQRDAEEEQRNTELAYSRALAVAASSGGGVSDPTVVKLIGDLQGEGEYRVLSKLFVAEDEAEGLEYRATVAKREGRAKRRAYNIAAVGSLVEGFGQ